MKLPRANKELGQHFLRDQGVIDRITSAHQNDCDVILEIGPGPGILSKNLSEVGVPYKVIEADLRFKEYLSPLMNESEMNFADALSFDYEKAIIEWGWSEKKIWLVSNLPYNISAPLTIRFLQIPQIKMMTLMYQREVAMKIVGEDMGSLKALCQNYFNANSLCKVPKGAFSPPPKVESMVVDYVREDYPEIGIDQFSGFEAFLRKLFAFKRKQLGTVLKNHFSADKIETVFTDLGLDKKRRAETLDQDEVNKLYQTLEG